MGKLEKGGEGEREKDRHGGGKIGIRGRRLKIDERKGGGNKRRNGDQRKVERKERNMKEGRKGRVGKM